MTTYTKTLSVVANVGGAMTQQGWGDQQWGSAFGGVSGYPALLLKNSFVRTLLVQAVAVITPSRHSIFGKLLAVTGTSVVSVVRKVKVTLSVTAIASLITRKTVDHIFGKITVTGTPDLVKLPGKLLTATSQGIALFTKLPKKLLSVVAEPAISMTRGLQYFRTLYVAVVGTGTVNKHLQVALSAIGEGIATVTKLPGKLMYVQASVVFWLKMPPIWLRMMVVTATASPTMDRCSSFYRTMAVQVQGLNSVFKFHTRDLAVQASAITDQIRYRVYDRTLSVISSGCVTVTKLPDKLMSVTVTGIPSLTRQMWVNLTVIAQGSISTVRHMCVQISATAIGIAERSTTSFHYRVLAVTVPGSVAINKHMTVLFTVTASGIVRTNKIIVLTLSVVTVWAVSLVRRIGKSMIVQANVVISKLEKWGIISAIRNMKSVNAIRSRIKGDNE